MTTYDTDIAPIAALLADRCRAAMLTALLDGRPLSAGELAMIGGVTAQTASGHLARLLEGDLVTVVRQGRHRYYRLSGPEVAQVIEALGRISPPVEVRTLRQSRHAQALRTARTCYDHLAGLAGVALLEALLDQRLLVNLHEASYPEGEKDGGGPDLVEHTATLYDLTAKGEDRLGRLGLDLAALRQTRRRFAGQCLDWTERRPHLNGALGAGLTARLIELGWFERGTARRALRLTEIGREGLRESLSCVIHIPVPT